MGVIGHSVISQLACFDSHAIHSTVKWRHCAVWSQLLLYIPHCYSVEISWLKKKPAFPVLLKTQWCLSSAAILRCFIYLLIILKRVGTFLYCYRVHGERNSIGWEHRGNGSIRFQPIVIFTLQKYFLIRSGALQSIPNQADLSPRSWITF